MATRVRERFRSIETMLSAAAYVDASGGVVTENDVFRALRARCGTVRGEGFTLPMLFAEADGDAVRAMLGAERRRCRRTSRELTVTGILEPMIAEFVAITRHSETFWQVTLQPSDRPREPATDLAACAAVTAGIVHDLRAPVQVVLGWASLLRRKLDDPDRIEHALRIIEQNAEHLIALLEDLLEQARPPGARAPLRRRPLDLIELVSAEVRTLQPLVDERLVRLSIALDSPAVTVEGDEMQLRRVVMNLLGNAVKFTPRHGRIDCRLWQSRALAGIEISDTGPGIPRDLLPRIFDPFVQSPVQGETQVGLGLGLAVVRHVVERHGGTVTAASEGTGRGATFTVIVPALPAVAASAEACHVSLGGNSAAL